GTTLDYDRPLRPAGPVGVCLPPRVGRGLLRGHDAAHAGPKPFLTAAAYPSHSLTPHRTTTGQDHLRRSVGERLLSPGCEAGGGLKQEIGLDYEEEQQVPPGCEAGGGLKQGGVGS